MQSNPPQGGGLTNRVGVHRTQFNGDTIGFLDDGGNAHVIENCNFEGGSPSILMSCTAVATIAGCEFEGGVPMIQTGYRTYHSQTGCGGDSNLTISNNEMPSETQSAISLGSSYEVLLSNNFFSSSVTAVVGVSSVYELTANSNEQQGTGATFDSSPTWGTFETLTAFGVGTAFPSQALEVNGGMRLNTATAQPSCSSATRGTFWFAQSASGVKDNVQVCAKDASDAYAWRVIF
jgi:hypothetical protein